MQTPLIFFMAKHDTRFGSWGVLALAELPKGCVKHMDFCQQRETLLSPYCKNPQNKFLCLCHSVSEKLLVQIYTSLILLHQVVVE